jgi:hypothetical protein
MKFRSTFFLFVVGIALVAYLYFFERGNKTTRERDDQHVVEIDRDKIDSISIRSPETKIELRKNKGSWMMEEPVKDRADTVAISQLLTEVDTLESISAVEIDPKNKEQLKEFGVSDSTTKAKFSGGGETIELIAGKDTAVEGNSYIYVDGAKQLHAVKNELRNQLQKKAEDFRDRKLADFGPMQISRAEIKSPAGVLDVKKVNNHWTITKPLQARGDDARINDLLAQAVNARIESFGSESNLAASGVNEPRGTVTFVREGVETPVVLSIGQNPSEDKDKDKTWAKLSTRDALVLVPKEIEKLLETKPNDLRDKNLLRVEGDIVDRITIEAAGGAKFVVGRKGESWVGKADGKDVPINDAVPPKILSNLQSAQVLHYVSDVATDLPQYGLDQPSLKVTLSSYASENTSETNAGEKPILSVLFGKSEENHVYAKLDNEPFVVAVSPSLLANLPKSHIEFQDLTIFSNKPEDITALQVTVGNKPTVELIREKDTWKLAKGDDKVDQQAVLALVNALSQLRALSWVGPAKAEDGFDKPEAVIVATVSQGGKAVTRKLTIGVMKEDRWSATADGLEGAFLLGRPDHDLFVNPLIEQPTTAPATGTATPPAQPMPQMPDLKAAPRQLPSGITLPPDAAASQSEPSAAPPAPARVPEGAPK